MENNGLGQKKSPSNLCFVILHTYVTLVLYLLPKLYIFRIIVFHLANVLLDLCFLKERYWYIMSKGSNSNLVISLAMGLLVGVLGSAVAFQDLDRFGKTSVLSLRWWWEKAHELKLCFSRVLSSPWKSDCFHASSQSNSQFLPKPYPLHFCK